MVEERVIAEYLTALLTTTITSQSRCRLGIGSQRKNSDTSPTEILDKVGQTWRPASINP